MCHKKKILTPKNISILLIISVSHCVALHCNYQSVVVLVSQTRRESMYTLHTHTYPRITIYSCVITLCNRTNAFLEVILSI